MYKGTTPTFTFTATGDSTIAVVIGTPTGKKLYVNINGTAKEYTKAYKNVNGSAVEIVLDEAFTSGVNYIYGGNV